jgi:hypothetical protein
VLLLALTSEDGRAEAGDAPIFRVGDVQRELLVLTGHREFSRSIPFRLPRQARQGADEWYTVHFNYRIVFSPTTGPGFVWVSASTNGRTAAQIKYTLRRNRERLVVRESSLDLVNGVVVRLLRGRRSDVQFRNYLQYEGVRGGLNELRFAVSTSGEARVAALHVRPNSGIFRTLRSPYPLKVQALVPKKPVQVGDRFRVELILSNRTGEQITGVEIRPSYDRDSFSLRGGKLRSVPRLVRPVRASFEFEARRRGVHQISFLVGSSRNRPTASIRLSVRQGFDVGVVEAALWALLFAPLATGLAYLAWPRGR